MIAAIGIIDYTFHRIGLHPLLCIGFYFRLDGAERNENIIILLTPNI